MRKLSVLAFFLVLCLFTSVYGAEDTVPSFKGYVNDYANVISPEVKSQVTKNVQKLKERTKAEIAVLTVDSVKPYEIQEYAQMVFEKWKIGDKKLNNGALIVVAVKDRKLWIATGYGIEGVLPDSKVGRIRDENIVPFFKKGDFSGGILNGVNSIAASIDKEFAKEYETKKVSKKNKLIKNTPLSIVLIIILFIVIIISRIMKQFSPFGSHRGYGGGYWYGGGGYSGNDSFGGGSDGGGFGGFGGGDSGGGGAGGDW